MRDFGLFVLRLVLGLSMLGHGTQKLFGWFGGPGLKGTQGMMETLGIQPGNIWGPMVAAGETSGGLLTALGVLSPLGPFNIAAAMIVAVRKVHWAKGFWASVGGIEFPLTNLGAAVALASAGPGRFSLDEKFGTRLPAPLAFVVAMLSSVAVYAALHRPQLAADIVDSAAGVIPGLSGATKVSPDLARETRPQPQDVTRQPAR
ncbi:MAG: DoxX family protein [Chloroflexota bacterium]|nr:DoxX family protein [Chloroflexota bacterium]